DRRAARLGHRLRELGARPNRLVAVVMEKGWEQVVAVLGILKSGAAYLPIDATLPRERIWHLLEQGEVEWAVTQPWIDEGLEWPAAVGRLRIEPAEEAGDVAPLSPVQTADDLAYVIFTSGSTGAPKGVMIDHRGALNTIVDVNRRFGVTPEDRVLGLSALNFDLSVYDVFGLLAAGGALVLPEPLALRDPARWRELILAERVTLWNTVPALMEMLVHHASELAEPAAAGLAPLRLALLSGDWIPLSLPERIRGLASQAEVVSLGGATEASIWSILFPIGAVDPAWPSIPYGRPMVNQTFHVLDERLEPCPVWVPGQLHISGIGLAKGYWRDEEKSRASFFTHPRTGERLYRTGDLGRYLPDGDIELLGREDLQVKVQGHRIELGEIEAALTQCPLVRTAVVAAPGRERGQRRLVAYVVLDDEPAAADGGAATVATVTEVGLPVPLPPAPEELQTLRRTGVTPEAVPLAGLESLLASVMQVRLDGVPLPKYRYPSAGSLYPVQTYLLVPPGSVDGLPAGAYYHDPREHRLVELASGERLTTALDGVRAGGGAALLLVARPSAVTPMYGGLAPAFCLLEAGYMARLLAGEAGDGALGLRPLEDLEFEPLRPLLDLEADQVLLHGFILGRMAAPAGGDGPDVSGWRPAATAPAWQKLGGDEESGGLRKTLVNEVDRLEFKLCEPGVRQVPPGVPHLQLARPRWDEAFLEELNFRRSDREYLVTPVPLEDLGALLASLGQSCLPDGPGAPLGFYLHVQPGRVAGLAGGTYRYQPENHVLVPIQPGAEIAPSVHDAPNREIFQSAAFSLLMVAETAELEPLHGPWSRDVSLLEAGALGQLLMTVGPAYRIGLCPLGSMAFDRVRPLFGVDRGSFLVQHFVGGRIPPRGVGLATVEGTVRRVREEVPQVQEIQAFLRQRLPEYMVPATVMVLDRLPLTANGKVDRAGLPSPDLSGLSPEVGFVAPRTPVEACFAEIWRDLLSVPRVGVQDNFFALGGDSVQGIQFLARARQSGYELTVRQFFEQLTVAGLAEVARPAEATAGEVDGLATAGLSVTDFPGAELTQQELDELIAEYADEEPF
ncbi:MAG TPA: amino acid adenylation domain-containing protein, partial [Thermoanaerobaculia bacterium]|nr:amino acid adenylation domain-containing protein [Thermoanaerobaculia bacterium]